MSASSSVQEAFDFARRDFLQSLTDPHDYDFSQYNSIEQVYDATEKIQKEQEKSGTLRNLNKIQPYLECMSQYVQTIDTFVQVKPEILAIIWGPIKLLLQISSAFVQSYDKILNAMAQIGDSLPRFQIYADLFSSNSRVQRVLCIFYKDILDFHATALNFFKKKKWRILFESLWPRYASKITLILRNIGNHVTLMDSEVTLANIIEADAARAKAYEEYERNEAARQTQQFESMRLLLSPQLYDDELERLRRKYYAKSGEWLENEDQFRKWIDPINHSTNLFWLIGIPGAGKTVLSSTIVDRAEKLSRNTLFAFLSFQNRERTTTLKVLQSFIFQLLYEHKDLQPMLYHANPRKISSSQAFAQSLLVDLLQCIGSSKPEQSRTAVPIDPNDSNQSSSVNPIEPVYVILDGVDEIKEYERGVLLQSLLEILENCENMKLLISSRAEVDISKVIGQRTEPIRIDHKNSQDIDSYVRARVNTWLSGLGFDSATSNEIRDLVKPIIGKSKGMFLYCKLVLDNLASQIYLEDIQKEVDNLPEGLDEAYDRIVGRLARQLGPRELLEARKILEWVGCSLVPIRKNELELALRIETGAKTFAYKQRLIRDIVHLCGPIIECQGDVFQFVHFTAKEYLFGRQSNFFLKEWEAHRSIASVCMCYLAFDCFDTGFPEDAILASILSGDYVLQAYAESTWLEHIKICARVRDKPPTFKGLCEEISAFVEERSNSDFEELSDKETSPSFFQEFKDWPEMHRRLSAGNYFMAKRRKLSASDGDDWKNLDPLTISTSSLQICRLFESLLCPSRQHRSGCRCSTLAIHYGTRLHKCDRLGCKFYRIGFETYAERKSHLLAHDRPFKCIVRACDFAEIGFISEPALTRHMSDCHKYEPKSSANDSYSIGLDIKGFEADLIADAIEVGEVDCVRDLLQQVPSNSLPHLISKAGGGSVEIMELLLERISTIYGVLPKPVIASLKQSLKMAVEANNVELVKVLLDYRKESVGYEDFESVGYEAFVSAFKIKSPPIIHLLLSADPFFHSSNTPVSLFKEGRSPNDEPVIIECLQTLLESSSYRYVQKALELAVIWDSSIGIAEFLLENGATVDAISRKPGYTILHWAARNTTATAAEMVRFLLRQGADPNVKKSGRLPGELPGAKNISQWLGLTWDELVESTRVERLAQSQQKDDESLVFRQSKVE